MKYEIGQKVTTPFGVGKIFSVDDIRDEYGVLYHFEVKDFFRHDDLKPYKTPREKLIEMGYQLDERDTASVYRHDILCNVRVWNDNKISCDDIDLELAKTIKEYLEWLEEEKWNIE